MVTTKGSFCIIILLLVVPAVVTTTIYCSTNMNSYNNYYDKNQQRRLPATSSNKTEAKIDDDYWNRRTLQHRDMLLVGDNEILQLSFSLYYDQKLPAVEVSTTTISTSSRSAIQSHHEYISYYSAIDNCIHDEQWYGIVDPSRCIHCNEKICQNNGHDHHYHTLSGTKSLRETCHSIHKHDPVPYEQQQVENLNYPTISHSWNHPSRREYQTFNDDSVHYSRQRENTGTKHETDQTRKNVVPTKFDKVTQQSWLHHCNLPPSLMMMTTKSEKDMCSDNDDLDYDYEQMLLQQYNKCSIVGTKCTDSTTTTTTTTTTTACTTSTKKTNKAPLIEIEPGHYERLRGAAETYDAVRHDNYVPVDCIGCNQTIFCIYDATYVCCPFTTCLVIGPNFNRTTNSSGSCSSSSTSSNGGSCEGGGGVGIGFTFKELAAWQTDILLETAAMLKKKQQLNNQQQQQEEEQNK